jgi:hypothetical protein
LAEQEPQGAFERSRAEAEASPVSYARCKSQPRDVYTKLYLGTQRAPAFPDEAGAICVVETLFGGRVRIYAIAGDPTHRRVVQDHDWRRP